MLDNKTISELIEIRQALYKVYTNQIIKLNSDKLKEVVGKLFPTTSNVEWLDVISIVDIKDMVCFVGIINRQNSNSEAMQEIIKLSVFINHLNYDNVDEICKEIQFIDLITNNFENEDINFILNHEQFNGYNSFYTNKIFEKYFNKLTRPKDILGFDTKDLTDYHIHQLTLNKNIITGIN